MSSVEPIRLRYPPAPCRDVHLLPCSVLVEKEGGVMEGEGGEVRVDSYFAPLIREENEVTAGDKKGNCRNKPVLYWQALLGDIGKCPGNNLHSSMTLHTGA